jgi:hypothetical protein
MAEGIGQSGADGKEVDKETRRNSVSFLNQRLSLRGGLMVEWAVLVRHIEAQPDEAISN